MLTDLDGDPVQEHAFEAYTIDASGFATVIVRTEDVFPFEADIDASAAGMTLANEGDDMVLMDDGDPPAIIDSVSYGDGLGDDWPLQANGFGYSLERIDPCGPSNDPVNWQASGATGGSPGAPNS